MRYTVDVIMCDDEGEVEAKRESADNSTLQKVSDEAFDSRRSFAKAHYPLLQGGNQLYGRTSEQKQIQQVYKRACNSAPKTNPSVSSFSAEFIAIHGSAGVGKTTLADHSLRSQVLDMDNGYFLTGKFDLRQSRKGGLSDQQVNHVFVGILKQLAQLILNRGDEAIKSVRKAVKEAIGSDIQVLTDRVPELWEALLKEKGEVQKRESRAPRKRNRRILAATESAKREGISLLGDLISQGSEAELNKRFKFVLRKLFHTVATPTNPLVLVLEDLQWADKVGIELIQSLAVESGGKSILYVTTARPCQREEEAEAPRKVETPKSNFTNSISWLMEHGVQVTELELDAFSLETVERMVSDSFQFEGDEATPLASLVHSVTGGNAFFICEFLRALVARQSLRFEAVHGRWLVELEEIRVEYRNVKDLVRASITELSTESQEVLSLASCLGREIGEDLFRSLLPDTVEKSLGEAERAGLVVCHKESRCWCFTHDLYLEGAYRQIPFAERQALHHRLGKRLWRRLDMAELDFFIFEVVEQLLLGTDEIVDEKEKVAVAKLCLRAGERSVDLAHFRSGFAYLQGGISLLGSMPWSMDYNVCLALHTIAAEVAYFTGQFEEVDLLSREVIAHAKTFDDALQSHAIKVYGLASSDKMVEGVQSGIKVLLELGEVFSSQPSWSQVFRRLVRLKKTMKSISSESLLRLPPMVKSRSIAKMQLLYLVSVFANMVYPELATLLAIRSIEMTLHEGLCAPAAVAFGNVAMILCGAGNDIKEGHRMGQLSFSICEKFGENAWIPKISSSYFGVVHGWARPIQETIEPLRFAYRLALDLGDIQTSLWIASLLCWNQLDITPLPILEKDVVDAMERMEFYDNGTLGMLLKPVHQMLCNLQGRAHGDPGVLTGQTMDARQFDDMKDSIHVYQWAQFVMGMVSYLFGNFQKATECFDNCRTFILEYPFNATDIAILLLYDSLASLAVARIHKFRRRRVRNMARRWARMVHWAKQCPQNFLGKQYLIHAEFSSVLGDSDAAFSHFTCAIALSMQHGFLFQAALANELMAQFLVRQLGDQGRAFTYVDEAVALYTKSGATAKAQHVRETFMREDLSLVPQFYESTGLGGWSARAPRRDLAMSTTNYAT